ncbi:hypothetical protein ZHAS_00019156 [Anopheles sinensis]|uniref:Uncharacterized protein n=1 Tax=Anopheles sinensis TaxID=74873 RepID=A0A084WLK4_ANOSI|nr:hypothetical protein ZHAS_00019156 [Anopheles sinensis]
MHMVAGDGETSSSNVICSWRCCTVPCSISYQSTLQLGSNMIWTAARLDRKERDVGNAIAIAEEAQKHTY